ncbi:hypothetical protein G7068_13670 [Leucobacter viscericola]|uniref:Uncharacterized protein n=1 Tax=Leucobacter viscericola TaxID=2714935 RepID=A0A6G7XIC4_9MICO|nr:hypothetical protein [Leucobacter viscericola]QIK64127.1 hypothetical protein G7068_13670 [Leucobacter viscericola]
MTMTPEQKRAQIDKLRELADSQFNLSIPDEAKRAITRAADALEATPDTPDENDRKMLAAQFREYLGQEIYWCSRDHSAWSHGTMGLDDFSLAADDDEIIDSLVGIALSRAAVPETAPKPSHKCGFCNYPFPVGEGDPDTCKYAKCTICGNEDDWIPVPERGEG